MRDAGSQRLHSEASGAEPPVGEGSRLGRNLTALAGGQIVTWTMTLIWTLVVPRALGPHGMGLLVSAWAATGILGIVVGLGTRNYLVREMVVDPSRAPQLLGTAIVLRTLLSPLFVVALLVFAHFAHYGSEGTLVLYLAGAAALLTLLAEPLQAAFQALERMEYLAYSDVINKSAQGLVGVALALLGFHSIGITASWVVVTAVVLLLNAFWIRRQIWITLRTSAELLVNLVKQSVAYWAFGVFFMIYLWIDSVMLSLLTRPEVVGWYGVPMRLFQSLMFLPAVISTAWLPRLVRAFRDSPEELTRVARMPLELVLVLSLPICAATAILARPLIHVLYGAEYDKAVPVLVVLGLCIPPMYLNIMLNQMLVAAKRQSAWTWVMAGATVVNPLLNAALIPITAHRLHNGAVGAAISLLLTEVLIVTVGFYLVGRTVFDRQVLRRFLAAGAAAFAMWGVVHATRIFGVVPSFATGVLTFAVLAVVLRVATPEELAIGRSVIKQRLQRRGAAGSRTEAASA
jgi:O-antigen/teichoic acid export membrane protein